MDPVTHGDSCFGRNVAEVFCRVSSIHGALGDALRWTGTLTRHVKPPKSSHRLLRRCADALENGLALSARGSCATDVAAKPAMRILDSDDDVIHDPLGSVWSCFDLHLRQHEPLLSLVRQPHEASLVGFTRQSRAKNGSSVSKKNGAQLEMTCARHRQFLSALSGVDWSTTAPRETPTNPADVHVGALDLVDDVAPAWTESPHVNEGRGFSSVCEVVRDDLVDHEVRPHQFVRVRLRFFTALLPGQCQFNCLG